MREITNATVESMKKIAEARMDITRMVYSKHKSLTLVEYQIALLGLLQDITEELIKEERKETHGMSQNR